MTEHISSQCSSIHHASSRPDPVNHVTAAGYSAPEPLKGVTEQLLGSRCPRGRAASQAGCSRAPEHVLNVGGGSRTSEARMGQGDVILSLTVTDLFHDLKRMFTDLG